MEAFRARIRKTGYRARDGELEGSSLDRRTVNGRFGIITDLIAMLANAHDSNLPRLDRQQDRFALDTRAVGLNALSLWIGSADAPRVIHEPTRPDTSGINH